MAITPAAGYVGAGAAIVIGAVAGLLCYGAMLFCIARGLGESLDAWVVHGVGPMGYDSYRHIRRRQRGRC